MICWSIKSTNVYIALSCHKLWPPGMPAFTGFAPSIEGSTLFWVFRSGWQTSDNVRFDGRCPVLKDHGIGQLIPHLTIPPINLELISIIPSSDAKVVFNKSTVEVNDTAAGAHFPILMPMKACGQPVDIPFGQIPLVFLRNTVVFGFDWSDFFKGWLTMAKEIAIQYLKHLFMSWFKKTPLYKTLDKVTRGWVVKKMNIPLTRMLFRKFWPKIPIVQCSRISKQIIGAGYDLAYAKAKEHTIAFAKSKLTSKAETGAEKARQAAGTTTTTTTTTTSPTPSCVRTMPSVGCGKGGGGGGGWGGGRSGGGGSGGGGSGGGGGGSWDRGDKE